MIDITRMWLCNPKLLCKQHLLGEHNEIHKIVGSLNKKRSISGYITNNCIEPTAIVSRHDALVVEMARRGYNHASPLPSFNYDYLPIEEQNYIIDRDASLTDLINRCEKCKARYLKREVYKELFWSYLVNLYEWLDYMICPF